MIFTHMVMFKFFAGAGGASGLTGILLPRFISVSNIRNGI